MSRKETSEEIRKIIVLNYEEHKTVREIASLVKRSHSTVFNIIKRYKEEKRLENKPRSGRPKLLDVRDERKILREIKQNPRISASKLAANLEETKGKIVNPETIRRTIRKAGYNGRAARRKFYVSEINRKKRLQFVQTHKNLDFTHWQNVIYADESKFNIFGSDGRITVWRKPNEEFKKKNLVPTVKHGGGGVMVWGCMSAGGVGDLVFIEETMTQWVYLNIMKNHLHQSADRMGLRNTFSYYQDNDPKHKSFTVRSWLLYNCPKVIETPPQSPDLNPIEHLWDILERKVRKHTINSKAELKRILMEEWSLITTEETTNLVKSVPRRL